MSELGDAEIESVKASHARTLDLVERQTKLIAKKLGEIERLKEQRDLYFKSSSDQALEITDLKVLLAETADWIRDHSYQARPCPSADLERRAREAAKS